MEKPPRKNTRGDYYAFHGRGLTAQPVDQFTVVSVEGNICYARYDRNPEIVSSFIWRFNEHGLNHLHYWSGRDVCGVPYVVRDRDELYNDIAF